jgi:hypothetical protein
MIGSCGESVPAEDHVAMAEAIVRQLYVPHSRTDSRAKFLEKFEPVRLVDYHERLLVEVATGASRK